MIFDVLKRKIRENLDATETALGLKDLNELYRSELDGGKLALTHVLTIIEKLEKDNPIQLHSLECDCWSGRSKKEIRERIAGIEKQIEFSKDSEFWELNQRRKFALNELLWVLSPSEKKCEHFSQGMSCPNCQTCCSACGASYVGAGENGALWLKVHRAIFHSVSKEKCEHVPSVESCLVYHKHGKQCVKCAKCGKWSSEWEKVSREEKPKCPSCGYVDSFCYNEFHFREKNGKPVFTLAEIADLMEKIEQSKEFTKWLGTIEDEGVGAFWLVIRFIRERPYLVEKIRGEKK